VARKVDDALRADILARAVDYVCENGLADLSLRPLAQALGLSPGSLLYHFGSKDALLVEVIREGRARQQAMMTNLDTIGMSNAEAARQLWRAWSAPRWEPLVRLFFEVYALALQDPDRFPGFLDAAVHEWLDALEPSRDPEKRADATLILAAFRGLLLDYSATHERKRCERAVDRLYELLDAHASKERTASVTK
jgi:AcrR family transcriptional regulator